MFNFFNVTKFYFNFITQGEGEKQINELGGFDASKFTCKQDEKRYGRDVLFAGGESNFSIYKRNDHCFELMQLYFDRYGFESEVELIIRSNGIELIYDVDFANMATDQLEEITFKAVQKSKQILLKRRSDVSVDLLSDKTLDGEYIQPCIPQKVLIKAKPISGISEWESTDTPAAAFSRISYIGTTPGSPLPPTLKNRVGANNAQIVKKEGVKNTLGFLSPEFALIESQGGVPNNGGSFTFIDAQEDIINAKIILSEISGYSNQNITNIGGLNPTTVQSGNGYVKIQVRIGFDIENSSTSVYDLYVKNYTYIKNLNPTGTSSNTAFPASVPEINVPIIKRGQRIWIYVNVNSSAVITGPSFSSLGSYAVQAVLNSWKIRIEGSSVAYNTVNPAIRLYDAMKYIVKSVSGMDIIAKDYEPGGIFYDQFIFTGKFLRGITDKGFNINFEEITKSIPESNSDFQITTTDEVFFGKYPEFYRNEEICVIDGIQFEDYKRSFNERYKINIFNIKYKNFQSQKEQDVENTVDVVHGETEWILSNKKVENKKEVEIEWIRDPFSIEEIRAKAYIVSDTAYTQDDDKKYILDCRNLEFNERIFKTTAFLQHSIIDGKLILRNTSEFSFILLGIVIGDTFRILSGSNNSGNYSVLEISGNTITLSQLSGTTASFNGEADTGFQYFVGVNTVTYTNWTNQFFSSIQNIADGNNFSNLKFSIKRNIVNYYSQYLSTANLFKKENPIANTEYKNNPDAITVYNGLYIKEGESFIPANPILSPYQDECVFLMEFSKYMQLENDLRNKRGFIRYIDANGVVTRGWASEMEFTNRMDEQGQLECKMEIKQEPDILKIFSDNQTGIIIINDFISTDKLDWNIDDLGYLRIFDETGKLLFTKTLFDRVSVNGVVFDTRVLLEKSLNNL